MKAKEFKELVAQIPDDNEVIFYLSDDFVQAFLEDNSGGYSGYEPKITVECGWNGASLIEPGFFIMG